MDLLPAPTWLIAIDQSTILPVDWFACREETQVLAARDCELFDADHNTAWESEGSQTTQSVDAAVNANRGCAAWMRWGSPVCCLP